jgi:hypothetical protein
MGVVLLPFPYFIQRRRMYSMQYEIACASNIYRREIQCATLFADLYTANQTREEISGDLIAQEAASYAGCHFQKVRQ